MSKWFVRHRCEPTARLRLFCFPYAGGAAGVFAGWEQDLPASVDVFALQAPGRAARWNEAPVASLGEMVATLAAEIEPFLDRAYVLVGHSNGALIAFELARELRKRGLPGPRHVVLAAKRAPHLPEREPVLYDLPYAQFVQRLRELRATPPEVLDNDELMEILEPMLRADFAQSDTYVFEPGAPLGVQVTLFGGREDENVPREELLAWRELFEGAVELVEFDGDHFFIHQERARVLTQVRAILEQACPDVAR